MKNFFTKMTLHNVDYDVIGVSYYPYWYGTFEQLFANLDNCKNLTQRNYDYGMAIHFNRRLYFRS